MITPVILSGGSGTRLWPLSRKLHPKQLLPLINDTSLLQDTVKRLSGLKNINKTVVVCNEDYRFIVAEQVRSTWVGDSKIILEPAGRNTAPAIALAAFSAKKDDVLLILPADHLIENTAGFHTAIESGQRQAERGHLVTFGIVPEAPETGYGYIKSSASADLNGVADITQFVEKPDKATAAAYISQGGYYWNKR